MLNEIRVLMVTERYLPIWGGAENQLRQLIPFLEKEGVQSDIVTRRWHADMLSFELMDGVPVFRLGLPGKRRLHTLYFTLSLIFFLVSRGCKYDVFHSHGAVNMGAICRLFSWFTSTKNLTKIATAGKIQTMPIWKGKLFPFLVSKLFKKSDGIVAISNEISDELHAAKVEKSRIFKIPNGVNAARFSPVPTVRRKILREKYGVSEKCILVLFAGRLVERKGPEVLIQSWVDIENVFSNCLLMILGSGNDQTDSVEDEIRNVVKEKGLKQVVLAGDTDRPEDYLAMADIFVFPSKLEGFPNMLLEAMASSVPVIASRIGGVVDLVEEDVNGLLFESGDSDDMIRSLQKLLSDPGMRERISCRGRQHVIANYSFEQIAQNYIVVYRTLLGDG